MGDLGFVGGEVVGDKLEQVDVVKVTVSCLAAIDNFLPMKLCVTLVLGVSNSKSMQLHG